MQVVWFKRDLRVYDNEVLSQAISAGDILPLYIIEKELWQQEDLSYRQYMFLLDCLSELRIELKKLGYPLVVKVGNVINILDNIKQEFSIQKLWSHQETWNHWTYDRDKKVRQWASKNSIVWQELTQNGVIRALKNRDGWSARWYYKMNKDLICKIPCNDNIDLKINSDQMPTTAELGLSEDNCKNRQKGGRIEALKLLDTFLYERGEGYTKEMSSPVTAFDSCSRLSAHIAFGTVSIREVFKAASNRAKEIKNMPHGTKSKFSSAMRSFLGRLRWHCHFIQKLEDEPDIEFNNMHSAYNGIRDVNINKEKFLLAWQQGRTGFPMIDACMRALIATGWLNFRMRAMLISFASNHLWLDWRDTALYLAKLFVDYEPGIHYSQIQMQSGTTGINSIRIYNPIKQGIDHDPDGIFILEWIPELKKMPKEYIHTPWEKPDFLNGYPTPIVDEKIARKIASDRLYSIKKSLSHKIEARKVFDKHGSRKRNLKKYPSKKNKPQQGELFT